MHKDISIANPIIRLPKKFIDKAEPDKRKKKVKLVFALVDNNETLIIKKATH